MSEGQTLGVGSDARDEPGPAPQGDPRGALTRALASETRTALARIQLAASEIERFGQAPSVRLRVDTIQSAVADIDALLEKLDVVSGLETASSMETTDLDDVLGRITARVAPVLRARGLVLERVAPHGAAAPPLVALPEAAVESIALGLLGVVATTTESPGLLEMRWSRVAEEIAVELSPPFESVRTTLAPRAESLQLELDVELAEWGGRSQIDPAAGACRVWLPAVDPAAADGERSEA